MGYSWDSYRNSVFQQLAEINFARYDQSTVDNLKSIFTQDISLNNQNMTINNKNMAVNGKTTAIELTGSNKK